jgi:hypothetical protein
LHRERDKLLLRAVMQIAFETPTLFVLGRDEALAGGAQVLDEPRVPQD